MEEDEFLPVDEVYTEGEPYPVEQYLDRHSKYKVGPMGKVTNGGNLPNMKPEQGAIKPHECHHYFNSQLKAIYEEGATHKAFHMTGGYPLALEIEPSSGLISGQIQIWNAQPILKCKKPELMKLNGCNWRNNGRPQNRTWTFQFNVYTTYDWNPPQPEGGGGTGTGGNAGSGTGGGSTVTPSPFANFQKGIYKTPITPCMITVIRTNDMDTLIFGLCYMLSDETPFAVKSKSGKPGENELYIVNHNLNVYGKSFRIDGIDDWVATHPGPFPRCERVLEYLKKIMGMDIKK